MVEETKTAKVKKDKIVEARVVAKPKTPSKETSVENEKVNESSVSSLIVRELMPSLVGLTPQEAMSTLKSFAPKIQIHGFGVIKRQIPESGSPLHAGARVTLFLGE